MPLIKIKRAVLVQLQPLGGNILFLLVYGTSSVQIACKTARNMFKGKRPQLMRVEQFRGELSVDEQKGEIYYTAKPNERSKFNSMTIV